MSKKKSALSDEAKARTREARALTKATKKQTQKLYKAKLKEMRPYLSKLRDYDLRHNLTTGQKSFIEKAWKEYRALVVRPTKVYRTKNKEKLKILQSFSGHSRTVKFDVAFVPTATRDAKLIVKGDKVIVRSKYVDEISIRFNVKALVTDPQAELARVIAENPQYTQFVVQVGEDGKYLWNGGLSRDAAIRHTMFLIARYSPGGDGYKTRGPNSFYGNWLYGFKAHVGRVKGATQDYLTEYHNAAAKKRAARLRQVRKANKDGKKK